MLLNTKLHGLHEDAQQILRTKDMEVKRAARRDKRSFVEELAEEAEKAAALGDMSVVYKTVTHFWKQKLIRTCTERG